MDRLKPWKDAAAANRLTIEEVPPTCDYMSEIAAIELIPGSLYRPREEMFLFVLAIESFFAAALRRENMLAFGSLIVVSAVKQLITSPFLSVAARNVLILGESSSGTITAKIVNDFVTFIVNSYVKMRGKDIVKRILGRHTKKEMGTDSRAFRAGLQGPSTSASSVADDDDAADTEMPDVSDDIILFIADGGLIDEVIDDDDMNHLDFDFLADDLA